MDEIKLTCATIIVFVGLAVFISGLAKNIAEMPNNVNLRIEVNLQMK